MSVKNKEQILYLKKEVFKIRNSKNTYIEIPEEFDEISHGDITERIVREEDEKELSVVFVFNKQNLIKKE